MKVTVELDFLDKHFPPEKLAQFRDCLLDLEQSRLVHGKIVLGIQDGKIISISAERRFEK